MSRRKSGGSFNLDDYIDVNERIQMFYQEFPYGSIQTELVYHHDGEFIVKSSVYRNPFDERPTTGYAREIEGSSYINKTSALENAECVRLTVPALTRDGWKFYHQLVEGEEVLTYNVEDKVCEWQPLQKVSVFKSQPLIRMRHGHFSADFTPHHKWVIDGELKTWESREWGADSRITLAARPREENGDRVDDAARLGWLFGDGEIKYTDRLPSGAIIRPTNEENIRVLTSLFGESQIGNEVIVSAEEVRRILGQFQVNDKNDLVRAVCNMTGDELDAFIDSMMQSYVYKSLGYGPCAERSMSLQIALFRAGHAASSMDYWITRREEGDKPVSSLEFKPLSSADVWCPTTENGTWVGLFSGYPAITGNTSAAGRALANMGYGTSHKRPSRQEMAKVGRMSEEHQEYLDFILKVGAELTGKETLADGTNLKEYLRSKWVQAEQRYTVAKQLYELLREAIGDE